MSDEDLSIREQLRSLSRVYWIANWMELVERFAYYGVRVMLPLFMVASFESGGPQLTHVQKGAIYGVWALVQSFIPIFTGSFADRYGYKRTIFASTVLKIAGYLVMGYTLELATMAAGQPLADARAAGTDHAYGIFYAGAMLLAFGTAIFKPGVQGLIANQLSKGSSSLGWGMFYQMVNVGGFIGPLLAGYLRILQFQYVFLLCAAGISLNFLALLTFKEPDHGAHDEATPRDLVRRALQGLLEPKLFFFTLSFAGFWLMFYQLFDILPNFINDWIDSRAPASLLQGVLGTSLVPLERGGHLTQEWIINVNALLISLFAFLVGYLTGKVHALTAIVLGIGVSALAILGLGQTMNGWWVIGMIALFSVGEMTASPTKHRYLASLAPPGREGQFMGYVNMTVGIGWSIGAVVAGELYQEGGDKRVLAKRYLVEEKGLSPDLWAEMKPDDFLPFVEKQLGLDSHGLRELLWSTYAPYAMWKIFFGIGIAAMVLILIYDRVTRAAAKNPEHGMNVNGRRWVQIALAPICLALASAVVLNFSAALLIILAMYIALFIASFVLPEEA